MTVKLYNDTVEIVFQESVHRYKVDGSYKPGVSSVLGVLAKDLMDWAAFMAIEHFKDGVSDFVTSDRTMTKMALKKLADDSKKAHRTKSQRGKDVGTIAHAWIKEETDVGHAIEIPQYVNELQAQSKSSDEVDMIDRNYRDAVNCIQQWRQWVKDYDIEFVKTEFIVYSKKLGYCGTADLLYRSRRTGKLYLGDYKTSEPQKIRNSKYVIVGHKAYPEHFVQIAGYDYAHTEEHGTKVDGYAVIYLPKEGQYQVFSRENVERDRQCWENLFKVYEWMSEIRKAK